MKHINHLFSLFLAITLSVSAWGKDYTVGDDQTTSNNNFIPFSIGSGFNDSFTQQLYLASELKAKGATAGNITAITFKYVGASSSSLSNPTRSNVEVWIRAVAISSFPSNYGYGPSNTDKSAGTKYFDGSVALPTTANTTYTITLDDAFEWNGTSNIIITINDKTNSQTSGFSRNHLVFSASNRGFYAAANSPAHDASLAYNIAGTRIAYVPVITFTFEDSTPASAPATPDDLAVSATTATSATLSWSAVTDADTYDLEQSANGVDWSPLSSGVDAISFNWTGLSVASTQYARIRAHNDIDDSDWSDAVTVTTDALHEHNGVSFDKWAATNALPTSGDYYLNDDVAFGLGNSDVTLTGNLNLCLNGKVADIYGWKIIVPSGCTLTIYDNVGGGKITGVVASEVGAFENLNSALIVVKSGGTLVLKEGALENNYDYPDSYKSYAIYSNGTLIMSGAPVINSNDADIYLAVDGVITLDGALTNSEKYSILKYSGTTLTSGWSTYMSGENPRDYLESASLAKSVSFSGDEASLRTLLQLSESSLNSSISSHFNQLVDVNLTRSITSEQYNTFCLPFALSNAQLIEIFGADYDLEEFDSSDMNGETLELSFNKVDALEAGKPYLLKPSVDVVNPFFIGVTIRETSPVDQTSDTYISFHGTFAPTELTGGNKNLLFLGANDELFWPAATGNLKGFRAYFEVKAGAARSAARVLMSTGNRAPQGIQSVQDSAVSVQKVIRDGKLIIIRDGKEYNAQGILIR